MRVFHQTPARLVLIVLGLLATVANTPTRAQSDAPQTPPASSCVMDHWGRFLTPGAQEVELIERIQLPEGEVLAFRLAPFTGDFAKLFVLMLDDSNCFTKAALIGSYARTQAFHAEKARAEGEPVTRLYHADLYDGDRHSTLGLREGDAPDYEDVRDMLLEALK